MDTMIVATTITAGKEEEGETTEAEGTAMATGTVEANEGATT